MISYLAALLAALTNATSNALNRKAACEAPGRAQFRFRLITDLLHRRAWLAAIGLMFLSLVFRSPRLQALQADETGPGSGPVAGRQEKGGRPVKAAGRR